MSVVINSAKVTVAAAPGVGSIALGAAFAGFYTFAGAGVIDGQTVNYYLIDGDAFEDGVGTYTAATDTLSRDTIQQSSDPLGGKITASAASIVYVTVPSGLGSAAELPVGTAPGNLVQVGTDGKVPGVIAARTGTVRFTIQTVADTGWVMFDDGTIGNAGSGATSRANADCASLFTLMFDNFTDALAPLYSSGGVVVLRSSYANAAAAFASPNLCRVALPKALGRALAVGGSGSGLTSRTLGQTVGEEAHTLTSAEQASMSVSGSASVSGNITISDTPYPTGSTGYSVVEGGTVAGSGPWNWNGAIASTGSISGTASGGGGAHNNMQPTTFLNAEVAL